MLQLRRISLKITLPLPSLEKLECHLFLDEVHPLQLQSLTFLKASQQAGLFILTSLENDYVREAV